MWLRDSGAQVWPYLPLAREDEALRRLIRGVVRRQLKCLLTDPYANAFNDGPTGTGWQDDWTEMKPELHERKWELDSPCYVIRLAHGYWKATGDASVFDARWTEAMRLVLKTLRDQQRREGPGAYRFQRVTDRCTGHPAQKRIRTSGQTRRTHRLVVPAVGRRHDLSVSDSVQLLRRFVAAQGCGDPAHSKPRAKPWHPPAKRSPTRSNRP